MEQTTIEKLKVGDFFTLIPISKPRESQVYIRDSYDRSSRKYCAIKFSDVCFSREFKKGTIVYVDSTF